MESRTGRFKFKFGGGEMIKVTKKILKEYKGWVEMALILLEDNPNIETKEGFYCCDDVKFNLNLMLKDIKEVMKK
jgi:hypothetical protein